MNIEYRDFVYDDILLKNFDNDVIKIGDVKININSQMVEVRNKRLHLTSKEYQILNLLVSRKGFVIRKEDILFALYGDEDIPDIKIIDVFVCKLRKKIELALGNKGNKNNFIETVWGIGYLIQDSVESNSQSSSNEVYADSEDYI